MGSPYDRMDTRHISEGRANNVINEQARYGGQNDAPPSFFRYVVLDVISDPMTLDAKKLSYYENVLHVSNVHYASVAPRNSIIARRVLHAGGSAAEKVMVLFPFFPPHFSFPAKPGEHVWAMFENPTANEHALGYWFCRIVQPNFVEDVNYTHSDRQFDYSFHPGLSDVFEGSDEAVYEFRNGAVDVRDGQRYTVADTVSLPSVDNIETAYSDLLTHSDASQVINYESVPRFRKRPADVALEGSNNTLIVLGTDRSGPGSGYKEDENRGLLPRVPTGDLSGHGIGSIDIVAGRGQTPDTAGRTVTNQPLNNKELAKDSQSLQSHEGDVDPVNDRSRVLVSQRTRPDNNFLIDDVVANHTISLPVRDTDTGEGAIVIKTDKIRLVARHDVVIMVSGADATDADGNVTDPGAAIDADKCATIIVRANGDIIFTPSRLGYVKLGGDDADKGIVCSDIPVTTENGGVVGPPLSTTMGGFFAGSKAAGADNAPALSSSQAKFANKVLVR